MQYLFAPLQGYTDAVFRETHAKHFAGIATYFTPFCRVEKGEMRWHDQKDINPERNPTLFEQGRLVPQIIGNSAEEVRILVNKIAELGYKRVDVNFGCPFPMIAKKQKGAGILACPDKVKEVLNTLKEFPDILFSVKTRLGMNEKGEMEALLPLFNGARLSHITLHPRIGKEQYKGELDMEGFQAFLGACQTSIVFNGEVTSLEGAQKVTERFPALSGVMIGRGLLQNPCLADECVNGEPYTGKKRIELIKNFMEDLEAGYAEALKGGEAQLVQKLTSFWEYLLPELDHKSRKKILKCKKLGDYKGCVAEALRMKI